VEEDAARQPQAQHHHQQAVRRKSAPIKDGDEIALVGFSVV
jgi:hypothetical protein